MTIENVRPNETFVFVTAVLSKCLCSDITNDDCPRTHPCDCTRSAGGAFECTRDSLILHRRRLNFGSNADGEISAQI
ncbi:hypothetical protein EVAR_12369_1 [Eumeta japonica]|uniref:Uncharacterized protein n=1 Tax=Eumeta variegata TaxID=151549 RepID=A0A4C1X0U2_EUMVA|nr:hypothetical protein EVAR_12369_1 [Eumeta japonica]